MTDEFSKQLKKALDASAEVPGPALEQVVQQCRQQRPMRRPVLSFGTLVRCELRMLGWKLWAAGGFLALLLYAVCLELFGDASFWDVRRLVFVVSGMAAAVSLLGLPFFLRAEQYRMREVEQATCAGMFRPAAVRFLLLFAGEAVMLCLLAVWMNGLLPWTTRQLLVLLAVPFLAANNELLLLLRRVLWDRLLAVAGVLFSGQLGLLWKLSQNLKQLDETGLAWLAVVLAAVLAAQCIKLAGQTTAEN